MKKTDVTIKLEYPIEVNGRTVTELTFRRPKNKDYMLMDKQRGSEREKNNWLMCHLAEIEPAVIEELDTYDLAVINDAFSDFLPEKSRRQFFG